jgi:hypothetical protein
MAPAFSRAGEPVAKPAMQSTLQSLSLQTKTTQEIVMKSFAAAVCLCAALTAGNVLAQQKPGAVAAAEVETVVTVRSVNHVERTVTVEGPEGGLTTIQVPPEAQNLYQVYPGAKFKVRYLEAVAIGVVKGGGAPDVQTGEAVELAPKGGTPGGIIARVTQITGKVEGVDYANRTLSIRGPEGNLRKYAVGEDIENFDQLQVGDTVGLRVTQAFGMTMLQQ